ncbi:Calcium/calmodulin-dependent protein kinase type I [Cytospora mali]|uniref:Calcium/calmodulin-dependent protein kinase type I n=1 Tax=Cytospora mali TaxID=578113 RepID=A0A194W7N5_CYTMA|nr:Calcium/calmodulin-dependent protein kinase type I [Valsa mali]
MPPNVTQLQPENDFPTESTVPVPTEQWKRELRERGNLAPGQLDTHTESTVPVPTEQWKKELRERGNLAPGQLDAHTESTVPLPEEQLKRGHGIFTTQQPGTLVSEHVDSDPETSLLVSETSSHPGLQQFFVWRDLMPHTPGIGQLELMPNLKLIFEQTKAEDHHQSYSKFLGVVHSRAETRCTFTINGINLAVSFIPWDDDAIVYNESSECFVLASVPDEFNTLKIGPKRSATIYPGIWELRGDNTSAKFQLRPRRYRLFLEEKSNKRAAEQGVLPPEKVKGSRGWRMIPQQHYDKDSPCAAVTRPVTTEGAAALAQVGLNEDSTLSVIDEATGMLEYSITRVRARFLKRDKGVDIFKAIFKEDGSKSQVVVVKMHKPRGPDVESAIGYWSREYNAHHGLQHRCIPSLVSFDSRMLTLMIEYKDFGDLGSKQWCSRGIPGSAPFFKGNVEDAYTILANISSALAYIAQEGIVHNDVKANNILYGGRATPGGAILIDFGLSRYVEQHPKDYGGGSPWYVAPEYPRNHRAAPADVWSLGVVMLYVMGRIPLPELEPEWSIYQDVEGVPKAVGMRQAWMRKVESQCKELKAPVTCSKETKLRELVCSMLNKIDGRITARELEEVTKEWIP